MNSFTFDLIFILINHLFENHTLVINIHILLNLKRDMGMNNIITKLNTITKSLYRVFPTLLVISPLSSSAVTIDPSTTSIQNFSQDRSYTINEGVSISTSKSEPAVWVNGDVTSSNDNGFTVDVMSETIDNSCNIVGKNYSILHRPLLWSMIASPK